MFLAKRIFNFMRRIFFVLMLMIMASKNVLLDFLRHASISDVNENVFLFVFVTGFATGSPAVSAFLVSAKMHFHVSGINVYRVVSDFVLALGLVTWFHFLFIRERPEYYEGASHMYIVTVPILFAVITVILCLSCLLAQGPCWIVKYSRQSQ